MSDKILLVNLPNKCTFQDHFERIIEETFYQIICEN